MLASSGSARARYGYSRSLLRVSSLTLSVSHSAALVPAVTPPQPPGSTECPPSPRSFPQKQRLTHPSSESSHGSDTIFRLKPSSSSSPPAASSSPPSSASTISEGSSSQANETYSLKHPSYLSSPALPTEPLPEAELRVRFLKWLNTGRVIPLDLPCTRDGYISTARLLETEGLLPRMARDFDPTTNTWHIRSRPHILHEIGHPVIGEIKSLLQPQLAQSVLGGLSNKLIWHRGSETTPLPNGGVKEPDAGIGLEKRALPTIVIEVGYSESRAKLRLDAHRWLQTGLPDRSRVKRKRGEPGEDTSTINPRPVMLVILISFEGKRPSVLDNEFEYSEIDFDDADSDGSAPHAAPLKTPKPLTVWVELWRLLPAEPGRPTTRSNTVLTPTMADRKRFWPAPEQGDGDFVELFATDIFGSDKVRDPGNTRRFKVPLLLFHGVMRKQMSIMNAVEEASGEVTSDSDDDVVVFGDEEAVEDAEDIVGHAVEEDEGPDSEETKGGGEAVLDLRDTADVVIGITPAEKRQKH